MIEFVKEICQCCKCSFEAIKFESTGHIMAMCDDCVEIEAIRIHNDRKQHETQLKEAKAWIQRKLAKDWLVKTRAKSIVKMSETGAMKIVVVCHDKSTARDFYKALTRYHNIAAGTDAADLSRPDMPCVFAAEAITLKKDRIAEILANGIPCIAISVQDQIKGWITQAIDFNQY